MADTARARKLADRIQQIVAETLDKRIKDPRLGFVTVTDTRVTADLQHATVFYTVLGDEKERKDSAVALESAKGKLRSEVGKGTGVRLTPTLEFVLDAIPENAAHIEELLREAAERDAEVAARASAASYAGEPDPYRHDQSDLLNDTELEDQLEEEDGVLLNPIQRGDVMDDDTDATDGAEAIADEDGLNGYDGPGSGIDSPEETDAAEGVVLDALDDAPYEADGDAGQAR